MTPSRSALHRVEPCGRRAFRIGTPSAAVTDARHSAGKRRWASVHGALSDVDGILYPSRLADEASLDIVDHASLELDAIELVPRIGHPDTLSDLADPEVGPFHCCGVASEHCAGTEPHTTNLLPDEPPRRLQRPRARRRRRFH